MSTRPRLTKLRLAHQSHKATKNGSVFPARIHERPSFLFGVDSSLPSSYPFVSWCLGVRFALDTNQDSCLPSWFLGRQNVLINEV